MICVYTISLMTTVCFLYSLKNILYNPKPLLSKDLDEIG